MSSRLLVLFAILWVCAVTSAHAHGVNWTKEKSDGAIVLAFEYSDGTQMAFAAVKVVDPDNRTFQTARTDRQGRFVLAGGKLQPVGEWLVSVNDGQGHVIRVPVQVKAQDGAIVVEEPPRSDIGLWPRALFGLSVIANLTIAILWFGGRRRKAKA